jgi:hypothetical protein
MIRYTQLVGEAVLYSEAVLGDTIQGAVWTSDPAGLELSGEAVDTTATKASVIAGASEVDSYTLQVELQLASGQVRKGQARIDVVETLV